MTSNERIGDKKMAAVSVPEKTLEHWCSQYVTYRYKAKSALWWPTTGADIDVRFLPQHPGKAFQIELKTTYFGVGYHDVKVDLGQLLSYWNRRRSSQPFYAFPWPDWRGELEPNAVRHGVQPTDLGFSRSGPAWWFAEWMVALTIDDVMWTLLPEITAHRAAHGSAGTSEETRGKVVTLVRFTPPRRGAGRWTATWGNGTRPMPTVIAWRDLWTELQRCGRPGWPQLVQLPQTYLPANVRTIGHSEVRDLLVLAGMQDNQDFGRLVWLESTDDNNFAVFNPVDRLALASQRDLPSQPPEPSVLESFEVLHSDGEGVELEDAVVDEDLNDPEPLTRPVTAESADQATSTDTRQLTFLRASLMT